MSALPDYKDLTKGVATRMAALRQTQPEMMSAFGALATAAMKDGALDKKTKELVTLGIAVAGRCDDCIGFHVSALVKLGTTRAEFGGVAQAA